MGTSALPLNGLLFAIVSTNAMTTSRQHQEKTLNVGLIVLRSCVHSSAISSEGCNQEVREKPTPQFENTPMVNLLTHVSWLTDWLRVARTDH